MVIGSSLRASSQPIRAQDSNSAYFVKIRSLWGQHLKSDSGLFTHLLLDFFAAYSARRSSFSFAASSLSWSETDRHLHLVLLQSIIKCKGRMSPHHQSQTGRFHRRLHHHLLWQTGRSSRWCQLHLLDHTDPEASSLLEGWEGSFYSVFWKCHFIFTQTKKQHTLKCFTKTMQPEVKLHLI